MIYNIFEKLKRKNKNGKNKPRPIIIADIHEKDSMILAELKENKDIELIIQPLRVGDYLIGDTIIERKTTGDFLSSMLNKRLIEQLINMNQYKEKLLIIEGKTQDLYEKINPNAIRGFIISVIRNHDAGIIFSKNYQDTAQYLITLSKQQLKPKIKISLHSRIPKTLKEQKQYVLESFPNIGPKTSEKLIKKFKTLKNTFNAEEQELKEILKNKSKNFKEILES